MTSLMIIITGPPATGKTTLASQLASHFSLPLIQFDAIQEKLFDAYPNLSSTTIAQKAYDDLFEQVHSFLSTHTPFVVESNFDVASHQLRFQKLENEKTHIIQIVCDARREKIVERFEKRWLSGNRHQGHDDKKHFEGIKTATLIEREPIKLSGDLFLLDTSDFSLVNTDEIYNAITTNLAKS